MSTELDQIRGFRASDATVDAASLLAARAALLAHIAAEASQAAIRTASRTQDPAGRWFGAAAGESVAYSSASPPRLAPSSP